MKLVLLFSIILMLLGCFVRAQPVPIGEKLKDSLKQELANAKQDTTRVNIAIALSRQYDQNNPDSAILFLEPALDLSRKLKFSIGEAMVLADMAYCESVNGNPAKALALTYQGLQIAEVNDFKSALDGFYNNLSNIYYNIPDYSKSLQYAKKKLANNELLQKERTIAADRLRIGGIFNKLNKPDSANYYSELGYNYVIKNLDQASYDACRYIGKWQMNLNHDSLAMYFFKLGVQKAEQVNSHRGLSVLYRDLAEFYEKKKQLDSAIFYAGLSLSKAKLISFDPVISLSSMLLAELYESKDLQQSIFYYKMTAAAKDSVSGAGIIQAMETIVNNEADRQQELKAAQKSYQARLRQYALAGGAGIFLVITLLLYRNNRQKQKTNNVLEKTLVDLKSTQSQLIQSEKMASLGELTAGIAHEIQNPLNFINNFSEVNRELIDELKNEKSKVRDERDELSESQLLNDIEQNLEKISHHGKRADTIVKSMLQHSRSNAGKKEPTDVNALCDEYLRLAYHGMRAKDKSFNTKVETGFDPAVEKTSLVAQDIGRVILNLINNAFYSVAEKKKQHPVDYEPAVSVRTRKLNDKIEISIKDNGKGIPQPVMEKIFQPFFTTKPAGQGTGLGLSLSYDIVKAHSGLLKAESKEGEFAEFIIQLPI